MFDKSTFFSHLSNTPKSTIQEMGPIGSPIMQSERGKFGIAGRAATNIAASTPAATELRRKQELERDTKVAARRQFEIDQGIVPSTASGNNPSADLSRVRYDQTSGEYKDILSPEEKKSIIDTHELHRFVHDKMHPFH
tara:strand:+ start:889 stop:1302 length:414 start_codon:yes stop_codon:yes gene_type:complete